MSPISMFGVAQEAPLQIGVKGQNLETLAAVAEHIAAITAQVPGTRDVKSSWEEGQPEIKIAMDRERLITISANLSGYVPLGQITAELGKRVATLELPSCISINYSGDVQNMHDMFRDMIGILLSLGLALGAGAEMRRSMAIVVIGALVSSTLLTMVLVPVVYSYMESWRKRFRRKQA